MNCLVCEDEIKLEGGAWVHSNEQEDDHQGIPQCPHTLGPIETCTICNGREKRQADADRVIEAQTRAKFISLLSCGHFSELDEIIFMRHSGGWVCSDCK